MNHDIGLIAPNGAPEAPINSVVGGASQQINLDDASSGDRPDADLDAVVRPCAKSKDFIGFAHRCSRWSVHGFRALIDSSSKRVVLKNPLPPARVRYFWPMAEQSNLNQSSSLKWGGKVADMPDRSVRSETDVNKNRIGGLALIAFWCGWRRLGADAK